MSGRWVVAGATLALSACGAAGYPGERGADRAPETCSASEPVAACEQRLRDYAGRLEALVGPGVWSSQAEPAASPPTTASQSVAGAPAPPAPSPGPPPAAAPEPAAETEAAPDVDDLMSQQSAPAEEMDAHEPDCSAARDLRDRICELADAICALAARPDAARETAATCDAARGSCERARSKVDAMCSE
jgi:hypothetical protein